MSLPRGARARPPFEGDNPERDADDCAAQEPAGDDVFDGNPKPCKDEPQDIADRAGSACSGPTDDGAPKRPDHVGRVALDDICHRVNKRIASLSFDLDTCAEAEATL